MGRYFYEGRIRLKDRQEEPGPDHALIDATSFAVEWSKQEDLRETPDPVLRYLMRTIARGVASIGPDDTYDIGAADALARVLQEWNERMLAKRQSELRSEYQRDRRGK